MSKLRMLQCSVASTLSHLSELSQVNITYIQSVIFRTYEGFLQLIPSIRSDVDRIHSCGTNRAQGMTKSEARSDFYFL